MFVRWSELGNPTKEGGTVIESGRYRGTIVEVSGASIKTRSKYSGDPLVKVEYDSSSQSGVYYIAKFADTPDNE